MIRSGKRTRAVGASRAEALTRRGSDRKDAPVTSFKRRWVRIGNRIGVWMYRAFDGRLASYNKDARVLMITTPGRTTGVLHSTCVRYLDTPEGLLVWGTASGAPRDPDWFRNLRKAKVADVQLGATTLQVRPHVLIGEQRDRAWNDIILAQLQGSRGMRNERPVALLEPIQGLPRPARD
jgi:deazaflavin-dependent oxidoreductase (nitroreductase family)